MNKLRIFLSKESGVFLNILIIFLLTISFSPYKTEAKFSTKEQVLNKIEDKSISRQELRNTFMFQGIKKKVKGQIIRLLSDDGTVDETLLKVGNKKYDFITLNENIKLESGAEAIVDGYELEGFFGAETVDLLGMDLRGTAGQQDLLVITFNWQNNTAQPFTREQIAQKLFSNQDSTSNYYNENSYGMISINGDINNITTSYFTVPYNAGVGCSYSGAVNNLDSWTNSADTQAALAGFVVSNYNRILYVFPDNSSCDWAGLGEVGGTRTWFNGYNSSFVYSHELGHNFGAGHSNNIACGTEVVKDDFTGCGATGYGDEYDVMGHHYYHLNATWKNIAGWIPDSKVLNISTPGTYTIEDIETSSTAKQAFKIAIPGTNDFYWFEYRQPIGFDSTLPEGVTRGLVGHAYTNAMDSYYDTYLLDLTPGDNDWTNIGLSDGATFNDPYHAIQVTQVNHNSSSVTFGVAFIGLQCRAHVENIGWQEWVNDGVTCGTTGQSKRLEAIQLRLVNAPVGTSIQYRGHVENIGWQAWVADGATAGTTGKNLKIESLQYRISGLSVANLMSKAHVQNIGWTDWGVQEETIGTTGQGLRVEAFDFMFGNPVSIQYRGHVQNMGWQSWVADGVTAGTTGKSLRIEAIQAKLTGMPGVTLQCRAHVENMGWMQWVNDSETCGTTGQSLRVEAIQLRLVNAPAGTSVQYRGHVQGMGWQDWVTNGATAGTTGQSLRVEAIQASLSVF